MTKHRFQFQPRANGGLPNDKLAEIARRHGATRVLRQLQRMHPYEGGPKKPWTGYNQPLTIAFNATAAQALAIQSETHEFDFVRFRESLRIVSDSDVES